MIEITCIYQRNTNNPQNILADFLKGFAAVTKYGRTVIYEGETYYLPYYMKTCQVEETGEKYGFLAGVLCEDISVFRLDDKAEIDILSEEVPAEYVLAGEKRKETIRAEISRKIRLNRRLRKMFTRFHIHELSLQPVYLPEQTFYGKGKSTYLFLVDSFLGKVDFKHQKAVEKRFVENCGRQAEVSTG